MRASINELVTKPDVTQLVLPERTSGQKYRDLGGVYFTNKKKQKPIAQTTVW